MEAEVGSSAWGYSVNRPLAAILAIVATICTPASGRCSPEPAYTPGQPIVSVRGGASNTRGEGVGWMAGGALGIGLNRAMLLAMDFSHAEPNHEIPRHISFWTLQLEAAAPFQHRISPRLGAGVGVYRTKGMPSYTVDFDPVPSQEGVTTPTFKTTQFGFNAGLGLSLKVTSHVLLDFEAREHRTLRRELNGDIAGVLNMTTAGAGLTYVLR